MYFFSYFAAFAASASFVSSAVIEYDWSIEWLLANPDGRLERPVVSVNGLWPGPTVRATLGDTIRITATNNLVNETTSLHWHGIHQYGTNAMDGAIGVTQCAIYPGQNYTYEFQIDQTGTYWWHSHAPGQYTDGLRGPFIIDDPSPPYHWDEEQVMTVTDWYHEQMPYLLPVYLSPEKTPDGAEPIPYSALINELPTSSFALQPGKTYFFRIINMAAFSQIYINFEDHDMTVIEVDGVYTESQRMKSIYIATGQRYGVLVTAKTTATRNYAIVATLDTSAFDHTTKYLQDNATGQLVYSTDAPMSDSYSVDSWDVKKDFDFFLVPHDRMPLLSGKPDKTIVMDLNFSVIANQNRATWNDITYISPNVPSIITALTTGDSATDPSIYGSNTNVHLLEYGDLVEVIINNYDNGQHPIHIHGHQPQIVSRAANIFSTCDPEERSRSFSTRWRASSIDAREASTNSFRAIPIRRDVWTLAPTGQTIIRFKAHNPGVWLWHCHMEWHVEAGLSATFIAAPKMMQQTQSFGQGNALCAAQGVPTAGNAVGNTQDYLNLTGEPLKPPINRGALLQSNTSNGIS